MAPAHIENVYALTRGISQAREQERSKIEDLEGYYLGQLGEDCRKRVTKLYDRIVSEKEGEGEGPVIMKMLALRKAEKELSDNFFRTDQWEIESKKENGIYGEPYLEQIGYSPTALVCNEGGVFMAIAVEHDVAEEHLIATYEQTKRNLKLGDEGFVIEPNAWDPKDGEVQLGTRLSVMRRVLTTIMPRISSTEAEKEAENQLSLVITCDITETPFGGDYIEVMEQL